MTKHIQVLFCSAFVLVFAACGVTHSLVVSRHTAVGLTNAAADGILADASTVLQTNDGPGDVACDVTLVRDLAVTTFATGNGIINSAADFTAVNSLPGNVKVVNLILWCGTPGFNIIGCAPRPGNSLVVVRFTANLEGILWVHEFGHNKGNGHRPRPVSVFVMDESIALQRRRVNSTECSAYRSS